MKTISELSKYYKTIAARADSRLRALEKLSRSEHYKSATQWAYSTAMKEISYWSGEGSRRFSNGMPKNKNSLLAKIKSIERFLSSPTSTKTGIKNVYQKKADTMNSRYGTDFTWEDLGNFFTSGMAEKLSKEYGSKTALKAIGTIQRTDEDIIEAIKSGSDVTIRTSNKKVNEVVADMLKRNDLDLSDLF